MHYLIMGNNQKRLPQLLEYLALFKAGTATDAAFRTAFGGDPSVLDDELRSYVSQYSVLELRQTFDDRVETAIPQRGEKIDDVEADTYLGDLQARVGRIGEARARLQKVLERRPGTARATLGLGLIDLRADRLEAALPLLERAATEGPDDGQVQGALGRALVSRLGELEYTSDEYAATLKRARSALVRAVELDPNSARSVALLGFAELASRDFERSVTLLTRAVALAPAREEYRLILAGNDARNRQHSCHQRAGARIVGSRSQREERQQCVKSGIDAARARTSSRTFGIVIATAGVRACAGSATGCPRRGRRRSRRSQGDVYPRFQASGARRDAGTWTIQRDRVRSRADGAGDSVSRTTPSAETKPGSPP
jgi:tetratricopeptide (TPR) repeat protein